ncbi:MAG: fused MFS/spermidine synthase [Herminiimonas sp.]|nr:fused MFS/spermidine synthase [Herminiimonas sp.]
MKVGLALVIMFASGAAGLVWQMVWTAELGVALGHEIVAVLSVMAAFFGGLAAGALLLANRIEHSRYPGRWYAWLEALIGVWALLVSVASPATMGTLSQWIGAEPSTSWHWTIAFFVPFVALLPATIAMGATLPAMERLLRRHEGRPLGLIYAINTAGALVGLQLAIFFFIPNVGLLGTSLLFAGVNLVCAVVAWCAWGQQTGVVTDLQTPTPGRVGVGPAQEPGTASGSIPTRLFMSGLLGVGYEVLAVRVLAQVTENTVYTYALLLGDFLIGTAVGAALLRRSGRIADISADRIDRAIAVLVVAVLLGGLSLWWAQDTYVLAARWAGPGVAGALVGEWAAGAAAMILPAMAMGALFTLLCRQAQQTGLPLGFAFGINTLGAALAPVLVGLLLLPHAGAKFVLIVLLCGYLAMRTGKSWGHSFGWTAVAVVVAFAVSLTPLRFVDVPAGGRLLSYREGVMAAVSVVEDAEGVARLHINNRVQEGSSASGLVETRLAQLPLLLHAEPRTALFLGYGTGYTANAAAIDPRVTVKAVELLPEVIDAAGIFALRAGAPAAARPVTAVAADARRYIQSTSAHYDVIVSDLFHPARNGAGSLYTAEHFSAVKARLAPGGLFCQWLALHQMDVATLRSIVAAFVQVYPNAVAVLASNSLDTPVIGLVARPDASVWQVDTVRRRLSDSPPAVVNALKQANIDDAFAVLGSVIAGPDALRAFAGNAPVNTDDHPVVAHRAPWMNYSSREPARDRLAALMHGLTPRLAGVVDDPHGTDAARLSAYWRARGAYLAVGMKVRPNPDPQVMLARLREPLLRIVAISPDFHPASEPLLALAQAVRPSDPDLSAQVEAELRQALSFQPTTMH